MRRWPQSSLGVGQSRVEEHFDQALINLDAYFLQDLPSAHCIPCPAFFGVFVSTLRQESID
jgi:hypothetical protein